MPSDNAFQNAIFDHLPGVYPMTARPEDYVCDGNPVLCELLVSNLK
jgi:hypothetical protein